MTRKSNVGKTALKSGLTGAAATAVAVAVCSQTGVAGMVGTGLAGALDDASTLNGQVSGASFPEIQTPLSASELTSIRSRLQDSASALDSMRAQTDAAIDMLRTIAENGLGNGHRSVAETPRASDVELARLLFSPAQRS